MMANFFAMGGYAVYIWPAYIVSGLVLGGAVVVCLRAQARAKREVRQLEEESGETGASQK